MKSWLLLRFSFVGLLAGLVLAAPAPAQDKASVPLTNPARPALVKVRLVNGSITVHGYEGREVRVEARLQLEEPEAGERTGGMKRIPVRVTGLAVEEENNTVNIEASVSNARPVDLTVMVPYRSLLDLQAEKQGDISVSHVEGEFDIREVYGDITLKDISGCAVVQSVNGSVLVTFDRINPQKPMAFSTLNGNIDVTFPANLKASVRIGSEQGEVYSDFDLVLTAPGASAHPTDKREGGNYRIEFETVVLGTINGGGQEIRFNNSKGTIYIRKAVTSAPVR